MIRASVIQQSSKIKLVETEVTILDNNDGNRFYIISTNYNASYIRNFVYTLVYVLLQHSQLNFGIDMLHFFIRC